jgi:hypothetical protein
MPDAIVVPNRYRTPTIVQRRDDGGVVLRQSRSYIVLDRGEFDRLVGFVSDAPELGKLARFPIAIKSPQTDK